MQRHNVCGYGRVARARQYSTKYTKLAYGTAVLMSLIRHIHVLEEPDAFCEANVPAQLKGSKLCEGFSPVLERARTLALDYIAKQQRMSTRNGISIALAPG
ncbi:unnamed protein product [Ectocarpus sp. 12 AP-2014]